MKRVTFFRHTLPLACLVVLASFCAYLPHVPAAVLPGDSGEFQFVVPLAGIAHPTGYPLYLLLAKGWSLLLPLSPAYAVNLFSAFCAALALGLFWAALAPWVGRLAALAAAIVLAASSLFYRQALVAEVYPLHSLFVCLLIFLLSRWTLAIHRPDSQIAPLPAGQDPAACCSENKISARLSPLLVATGATLGLAFAHHRAVVLLLPALLFYLWATLPDRRHPFRSISGRALAATLVLLVAPLLLYLYIPLRVPASPYLTQALPDGSVLRLYENSFAGFLAQISGSRFAGELSVDRLGSRAYLVQTGRFLLDQFAFPLGQPWRLVLQYLPCLLAAIGLAALMATRQRNAGIAVLLSLLCTFAFTALYTIGDIADYYTPALILLALALGAGISATGNLLAKLRRIPAAAATVMPALLLVVYGLALYGVNLPGQPAEAAAAAATIVSSAQAAQPAKDSLLVSNDRDDMTPLYYRQYVQGWRPDLVLLYPGILPQAPWDSFPALLDRALAASPAVYLIKPMPGLEWRYRITPVNQQVQRISLLPDTQPQHPLQARLGDLVDLLGYDLDPAGRTVTLHWRTTDILRQAYQSFVVLTRDGQPANPQQTRAVGSVYDPASGWPAGTRLQESYSLSQTLPAGRYRLETGWFAATSGQPLPAKDAQGRPLGERVSVPFDLPALPGIAGRALPAGSEYTRKQVTLGTAIVLDGYRLVSDTQTLDLTLIWGANGTPARDYTIFVQILDAAGHMVEQQDLQPEGGFYPTSLWVPGDRLAEHYTFKRPAPGSYRIICGMYDPADGGKRLATDGGADFIDVIDLVLDLDGR